MIYLGLQFLTKHQKAETKIVLCLRCKLLVALRDRVSDCTTFLKPSGVAGICTDAQHLRPSERNETLTV